MSVSMFGIRVNLANRDIEAWAWATSLANPLHTEWLDSITREEEY